MDGHRVNVQFPIPEQAGEADGHVFQCAHNRFFLSAAKSLPRRICFLQETQRAFSSLPKDLLFRHDPAEDHPLRRDIGFQERRNVLRRDGFKYLREAEGIIAVEVALRQGHSDVLKGVQSPEIGAEGCLADSPEVVFVHALRRDAGSLPQDGVGDGTGILAVAAGVEIGHAGHHLKGPAEAGVDEALLIKPLIQRAGLAQQNIAGHVAQDGGAHIIVALRRWGALEARQELRRGDLHLQNGLLLRHGLRLRAVIPLNDGAAELGQHPVGQIDHMDRVHVAHHRQNHVGRGIKCLMAVIQRVRSDFGNALHCTGNAGAGRMAMIHGPQHPGVDLPVGVVLDHADLLTDDALLLGNTLIGEIENGQYTEGLIIDAFNENNFQIDDEIATAFYMYSGYYNVMTNYVWKEGEDPETNYRSFMNGKQATFNLATNTKNYVNNGQESIIPPMRKINGNIDLYQYNYYNSFQARFCHDLNRDKNGNGVIDYLPDDPEKNEFEWYLPSTYQAFGILTPAGTIIYDAPNALALERNATLATGWMMEGGGWYSSNTGKNSWKWVRCVRDIPVRPERKTGTKVTTYIDNGDTYALIDLSTLPYGITDRTTAEGKTELYEELDLYSYSTKGTEYDPENPQKDASQPLGKKVFRGRKNYPPSKTTTTVTLQTLVSSFSSPRFIVSPTDVYNDGDTKSNSASSILQDTEGTPQSNSITMTWAEANGRLNTANSQGWNIPSKAMNTGCYAYKGKSGKDEPGSWRVPNSRELSMILVFAHELERFSSETGFQKLYEAKAANYLSNGYWSSTEQSSTLYSLDKATSGLIDVNYGLTIYEGANKTSTDKNRLRCIKDIPLN